MRHMQMNPTSVVAQNIEEDSKRAADLMEKFLLRSTNESEELEKAIETIQIALSGSFRDNLKIEITQDHAWLTYGDLKFLVEPMEAWQAVQSCVYLSGLEVENE
jgi:predicted  nucleic acid-binding Zn-ribbon protein